MKAGVASVSPKFNDTPPIEIEEFANLLFAIAADGSLQAAAQINSMDTLNARYWHEPRNEREFNRSPQRALWLTAKELKWDQYLNLSMFTWVLLSSVDRKKHTIYNTLWAYKIKLNSDTSFKKLNPRRSDPIVRRQNSNVNSEFEEIVMGSSSPS